MPWFLVEKASVDRKDKPHSQLTLSVVIPICLCFDLPKRVLEFVA